MKKDRLTLYLAHPFDSRHDMREWELLIEKYYPIDIINPFFDVEREDQNIVDEKDETLSSLATRKDRYGLTDEQCATLVRRDVMLISQSDGVIVIIDGSLSYGTIQEMVYAFHWDVPVYSVITNGHIGHPWLRHHSRRTFLSLDELEEYLVGLR
jgi:nucleoside 2-deoxyribosyltransferase